MKYNYHILEFTNTQIQRYIMFELYDLVRPIDDEFKSIWQINRLDENGGALLYRIGHNPNIQFQTYNYGEIGNYYSETVIYCFPGTFVKLNVTEVVN